METLKRIVILDSNSIYANGAAFILNKFLDNISVNCLNSQLDLKNYDLKKDIDLIIIEDVFTSTIEGILSKRINRPKIIATSILNETINSAFFLEKGVNGFIPKMAPEEYLINTVKDVLGGKTISNNEITMQLKAIVCKGSLQTIKSDYGLSKKEMEMLYMVTEGKSNKQIAEALKVAERTVEFHKTNIYKKTGSSSIADLVLLTIGSRLL